MSDQSKIKKPEAKMTVGEACKVLMRNHVEQGNRFLRRTFYMETENKKFYLGDSVYGEYDGYGIWLTTNNGYPDDPRNKIYLEPSVIDAFNNLVRESFGLSKSLKGK